MTTVHVNVRITTAGNMALKQFWSSIRLLHSSCPFSLRRFSSFKSLTSQFTFTPFAGRSRSLSKMTDPNPILGRWKLVSNENLARMMEKLGYDLEKLGLEDLAKVDPITVEWNKAAMEGSLYQIVCFGNENALGEMFTPGKQFTSGTLDRRNGNSVITIDGHTLTHTQTIKGPAEEQEFEVKDVRVFERNRMVTTTTAKGVDFAATSNYEKM